MVCIVWSTPFVIVDPGFEVCEGVQKNIACQV